jgi:hypothetical protein
MVPTTPLVWEAKDRPIHESINDIYVHPATKAQVFYPVSESRQFSRADAGHAFDRSLLPTERRIPHPEMVQGEKLLLEGAPKEKVASKVRDLLSADALRRATRKEEKKAREAALTTVVASKRWDFKFRDFDATDVGKDGRKPGAVGYRYGAPHEDRKKGQIKIPRRVLG